MFALNEPNFELENYSQSYAYFLEEMYSKLGNGATNFESLHNKLVSPKKSIKLFSDHDLSSNALLSEYYGWPRCLEWKRWLADHPELSDWIEERNAGKAGKKPQRKFGSALKEAYDAVIHSYVHDVKNGIARHKLVGVKKKIDQMSGHYLYTVRRTIGQKWPNSETLRRQIYEIGSPKKNELVRSAQKSVNPFGKNQTD